MGWFVRVVLVLAVAWPVHVGAAVPAKVDPEAPCTVCHDDVVELRAAGADFHAGFSCDICHPGRGFNPHVAPELGVTVAEHHSTAYTACELCHAEAAAAWRQSIHGPGPDAEGRPFCQDCHGSIHLVTPATQTKREIAVRCVGCHSFAREGEGEPNPNVVDTYRDTIHGKLLALGSDAGASCADCHGGHAVFGPDDIRSSVHEQQRVATCAQCHPGATRSFAAAISHRGHTFDEDPLGWMTGAGFSLLTVGVMVLLFLHVLLDFLRTGQQALTGGAREALDCHGPVDADQPVPRFDIHSRMQHWGLMASFILLVITGWPLKAASVGEAGSLAQFLGGRSVLANVHRVSGVILIAVSFYHLGYLLHGWRTKKLGLSMVPMPRDIADLFANLQYFFGLRAERPSFGRWTYFEKFDYWAVFWGMVIMGGSGLLLWFPELASRVVPGQLISLALIAHSDEALLALLAIFLWHFYNVHLRPTVFPMNWAWLTGSVSAATLYEDHRAEYESIYGPRAPRPAAAAQHWYQKPGWSYAGVAIILMAAVVVLAGNVSNVRDKIAALQQPVHTRFATGDPERAAPGSERGVYAASFDAFTRCFACHNQERYRVGGDRFPHEIHLQTLEMTNCADCHVVVWHERMTTATELCVNCHDAEALGANRL